MKTALMMMVLLAGCVVDGDVPDAVTACRAAAARNCDGIGYGGNPTCLLVFAAGCSTDDAEAAREACVAASGAAPDAECALQWR